MRKWTHKQNLATDFLSSNFLKNKKRCFFRIHSGRHKNFITCEKLEKSTNIAFYLYVFYKNNIVTLKESCSILHSLDIKICSFETDNYFEKVMKEENAIFYQSMERKNWLQMQ